MGEAHRAITIYAFTDLGLRSRSPSSVAPHQRDDGCRKIIHAEVDNVTNYFGSAALLGDTDVQLASNNNSSERRSMAPGGSRPMRHGFNGMSVFNNFVNICNEE